MKQRCNRCDKPFFYVSTKVQIRVPTGDSTWYAICSDCYQDLRFWLYNIKHQD